MIAEEGNMPNVIICGPPGTGKTTSVHALAHTMLGDAYGVRHTQQYSSRLRYRGLRSIPEGGVFGGETCVCVCVCVLVWFLRDYGFGLSTGTMVGSCV